ncbi:MAG: hypothetical protein CVU56_02945 [Deltaproteobacteria bacterium HGW-Deltaproteobacteria-14]|jgi:ubiquinone/menaquinone biosynthesis C-methylase UbiE|nr:MAG: hypothetical protein CVU56_02945 [Deltaproteobacteria bacterium HGW-Deltaproteobacteria-14]
MDAFSPDPWVQSQSSFVDLYDLAFGYRDFAAEASFLAKAAQLWGDHAPRRVIEWAAGPGRHLAAFAARGAEVVAVDLSSEMLSLAARTIHGDGRATLLLGDMCEVTVTPPADLGFTMLSSIHGLASEADLLAHLAAAARSLKEGAIYVIEATHPRDLEPDGGWATAWHIRAGEDEVYARFTLDLARRDGPHVPAAVELRGRLAGVVTDHSIEMAWLVPDLDGWRSLVEATPGLTLVAALGGLDVTLAHTATNAWRLVLVLRRD